MLPLDLDSEGASQQKRFLNWMTYDALRAEYEQWCEAHDVALPDRARRTLFEKTCKEWRRVLGFRKVGQHARCLVLTVAGALFGEEVHSCWWFHSTLLWVLEISILLQWGNAI